MRDDNERALFAVLDGPADEDVPATARQAAERDVAAIRRGMALLAHDAPRASHQRRLDRRWLAVAATVAVLAAALALMPGLTRTPRPQAVPGPTLSLRERVDSSQRIVVGTVTTVNHGRLGSQVEGETGDRYVLATLRVEEAIKGGGGDVVAFSYDFAGVANTSEGSTRPWKVGDHLLLFLVPDTGTLSASITPAHMQVAGGEAGRYFVDGNRLAGAGFTLDDVRRVAR